MATAAATTTTAITQGIKVVVGTATSQGGCPYQEDRSTAVQWQNGPARAVLGVFDGHAGFKASEYCRKHMAEAVHTKIAADGGAADPARALDAAFREVDAKFLRKLEDCGAAVVVALVTDAGDLWVANAGDSRCVLGRLGGAETVEMSHDHKPSDETELARIRAAGHDVEDDVSVEAGKRVKVSRVDGRVACSRGIGDGELKDYGVPPEKQAITCVPDVKHVALARGRDDFVVLATDGLWDVVASDEAVKFVGERIAAWKQKHNGSGRNIPAACDLDLIAAQLVEHAVQDLGSQDNTTVVIAVFEWLDS